MSNENKYAIIGMFAIVITLYALKESHTHWLPDLFGLALALTAQRPSYGVGAVILLAMIRHSYLAHSLAESVPGWLVVVLLPGARIMSRLEDAYSSAETAYKERLSESENELEYVEIPQRVAENVPEEIDLEKSELLARLVLAGEVGLTKAIQIGAGAQSGKKYQRWTKLVKLAMERQQNHYPASSTLKRYE